MTMYYYRVTLAYKGTHYSGWQAQSLDTSCEESPTVEGTIVNVLKKIAHDQPCTIAAASRTDSGVHAQGQQARITLPTEINSEHLLLRLNAQLPDDIRVLTCTPSTREYQPNKHSASKEYHYYFVSSPIDNVATSDIALHLPSNNYVPDNLERLRAACQLFVGRHDFYSFSSRDKSVMTSVREVLYCDIHQANFMPMVEGMYYLKIVGDGFLKYMVRYIMGALLDVARGRITLDDISRYLQQHHEHKLSHRAKAKGLHLMHIEGAE